MQNGHNSKRQRNSPLKQNKQQKIVFFF